MRFRMLLAILCSVYGLAAQTEAKLSKGSVPVLREFHPDSLINIQSSIYTIAPKYPSHDLMDPAVKAFANRKRAELLSNPYREIPHSSSKRTALNPVVAGGFSGATLPGTPNDNNMAINNDSMVISVMNTYIRVYNTNGVLRKNWGLEFFPKDPKATKPGNGVGDLNRSYDPKVVYDPDSDRFIIVFLEGDGSADTRIIVAFSKTNNPLDGWNIYQLNGNPFGGTNWTDYPMIAINGRDLFITVNILKDNTDWKVGFQQSIIWQVPKTRGYNADTLQYNLWSDIKHNGKSIWNICPVQEAFQPGSSGLYLLSVRPGDISNDTVFLHRISGNFEEPNVTCSYKILKADKSYGVPPSAPQPQAGFKLQTNDARVLGAFFANGSIQYVQTSRNSVNGRSSVFHGLIQNPAQATTVKANLISFDTIDIAYPTIVHAGNSSYGKQSMITFSHSGENVKPGTSVIYYDNNGEYSEMVVCKAGEGYINSFIVDSMERWGDYTAIQRNYKNPKEFWLVGSYGRNTNVVGTWVSKISMNDPVVSNEDIRSQSSDPAYPNPVIDWFTIPFELNNNAEVRVLITDAAGRQILELNETQSQGKQKAIINTSGFASGIYYYTVFIDNQISINGVFSRQ